MYQPSFLLLISEHFNSVTFFLLEVIVHEGVHIISCLLSTGTNYYSYKHYVLKLKPFCMEL